ncbi:MAG: hypothetical protein APR54_04020 [Candidatus Cloacimonas sp. SDB]|nr:MAG: hypothetical protein APR54_04020 [Candidatus Cloacimonas sp. SDB]
MNFEDYQKKYRLEFCKFTEQRNSNRRLWNISDETASFIFKLVLKHKPKNILEIGTSNGYSTFWLSLAAEEVDAAIDSIEVDESRYRMAQANLLNRKNVNLIHGLAEDLIPQLTEKYDFIFIDAGKIGYVNYIRLLENKLNPSAIIVADNVISHRDTVRDYLDYLQNNDLFETETQNLGSGLEVSIYNPNSNEES